MTEPIIVSRFDVAMEPAIEEEQILTIGAIAEDGRPVALLLDPETRRKVGGWLVPTPVEVLANAANELHELWRRTQDAQQSAGILAAELRVRDMAMAASTRGEKDTREDESTPLPHTEARAAFMQVGTTPMGGRAELHIEGQRPLIGRYCGAGMQKHDGLLIVEPVLTFEWAGPAETGEAR
jgi:hypothetical protein